MQILNEQDIINVMNGAALLAAGGGGCFDDGMILLESFKKNHPEKRSRCAWWMCRRWKTGLTQLSSPVWVRRRKVLARISRLALSMHLRKCSGWQRRWARGYTTRCLWRWARSTPLCQC